MWSSCWVVRLAGGGWWSGGGLLFYSLCIAGCRGMHRDGRVLVAFYNMYSWSCVIYRDYRALLVLYSMNRSGLAIYRVGGVGDMRHIKRGWGQHRSGIGM